MIQYDSRKVKPGDTFVAIPGAKQNGADFISQAMANGAKVIISEKKFEVPSGVEFRLVPSARKALAQLSAEFYGNPSRKLKLIGVTGTKGKTTVTYLINAILTAAGFKSGLIGTINSPLTTPESADLQAQLAGMVKEGYTHCVLEVSSHALAQDRVFGCRFAVAIFTNLTHDHLDYHRTMDEYLLAKRKLFEMIDEDSIAIVNVDDPASRVIMGVVRGEVIPFGIKQAAHELRSTKYNEFDSKVTSVNIREKEMGLMINSTEIRTPLIGMHNVYNIAAAFQCGLSLGIRPAVIKKGIESVKSIPGRQEEIDCGQPFRIIVDFAHSPDSLEKLLETYRPFAKGRLILVFGCPGERDRDKRPIMGEIAVRLADYVIITSDDPHAEDPDSIIKEILRGIGAVGNFTEIPDRSTAIARAIDMAGAGDIVLVAGRGHEEYQEVAGKMIPLDDRKIVKELCKKKYP